MEKDDSFGHQVPISGLNGKKVKKKGFVNGKGGFVKDSLVYRYGIQQAPLKEVFIGVDIGVFSCLTDTDVTKVKGEIQNV